ncbi:MAG: glycosyltransferase family 2 protein [Synergistaceae bacterium]|nr:glycosyltransferase family 2 protein [Synergistaceae bacterium]
MKKISVLIPTYNEQDNVEPLSEAIINQFETVLTDYDYEILFIDNHSSDDTRSKLIELCENNKNIKAIFNSKNFGQFNSPYHGLLQTSGDCVIAMCADFQDPIGMIPQFVSEWEKGYKVVCGIKTTSKENSIMYFLRSCYYKLIRKMSNVDMIEHFTGFGLYDKSFINVLRGLNDPIPFFRGMVAELGGEKKEIPYEQQKRKSGRSKNNFYSLYDAAMLSFTTYTKVSMRVATLFGFICSALSMGVAFVYLILKLLYWQSFPMGTAPILIGVFFFGSVQLFFIGFLGEYIMNINARIMNRPLVIEERRINFD